MRKVLVILAGLALCTGVLAGCGGGNKSDKGGNASGGSSKGYCADLKDAASNIAAFTGESVPTAAQFEKFAGEVKDLAAEAPSAVADDWKVLADQLKNLTDALDAAGITLQQLVEAATSGKLPAGMTEADFTALGQKLQQFAGSNVTAATTAIESHAKDACGVTLSTS
jgi:hypothetical protein